MHPYSLIMYNQIKVRKQVQQTSEHTISPALALRASESVSMAYCTVALFIKWMASFNK